MDTREFNKLVDEAKAEFPGLASVTKSYDVRLGSRIKDGRYAFRTSRHPDAAYIQFCFSVKQEPNIGFKLFCFLKSRVGTAISVPDFSNRPLVGPPSKDALVVNLTGRFEEDPEYFAVVLAALLRKHPAVAQELNIPLER